MNAKHWPKHITCMTSLKFHNNPVNEGHSLHLAGEEAEAEVK